ncbi:T9SS type A sorting domain-containing protein [Flavobacterium chuncheonense]|uniref:T9SS type A sorting domain-containing protein n=1 Tax=Flavobacterium chuncheonense TaxID=2026653 RepID=A0ABW5YN55_9FLAO
MKKYYLTFSFLLTFIGFAQFNTSAPWMTSVIKAKEDKVSIEEITQAFDAYWKSHDKNKKGSGYKPYKRWEYHWENNTNEQGYLVTPQEMWDAWNLKRSIIANKSNSSLPLSNWQPVGPFTHTNTGSWSSGQGRVNFVYQDPNNVNTIYLGAPAGGIWKSVDAGVNWLPLSDYLPQIGVSGIVVDHSNSSVIYIATGDKDASDTYSIGVMKSIDGGASWSATGLTFSGTNKYAGDIIMHPTNNQILFCATNNGVYKTTDAGATWAIVQTGDFSQGAIRFKPNDPTVVYGVTNTSFYKSVDTGLSFSQVSSGLPATSGRLLLDVTPANENYIYVLSAASNGDFQGVYRSINGGISFVQMNGTTNVLESDQAWYDLALAVSDTNADEVYTGCLNIWKSTNGGTSFSKMNNWSSPASLSYTHADIHYLGFYSGKLFAGTDGGVYVSQNGGTLFTDLTATAQISQFYKIAVSKQSSNNMVGGLQDNGGHAYSGGAWKNYYGADGMDTAIDPNNPNLYYGFIQNGSTLYISGTGGNGITSNVSAPSGVNGNWVTPLVVNSVGEVFAGYDNLYRLQNGAWVQQNIGSLGTGKLELIAIDPSNDDIIYVSNETDLYKSTNNGVNFSLMYTASSKIRSIEVHSYNSNIVYLTTSGSSGKVMKSVDGGSTFADITSGIPNIGKNVIVHQGQNTDNPLYVGTSLGVYYRDDTMSTWQPFDINLPNVAVTDLEINLEDSKITAATYGRGIWQSAIPVQVPADDVKLVSIDNPTLDISCGNIVPSVTIKNNGQNSINTVQVDYVIDGVVYTNNWNGTLASGNVTSIALPSLTLSRGIYTIDVVVTMVNDAFPDNNSILKTFYVNDNGTIGTVNTFSDATDELISYNEGSSGSQWIRGLRSGTVIGSGTNMVYASNLTGEYPNNIKSFLVSQCYNLTNVSNPEISFKLKYDLELNWDVLYVEYSTDFGANWDVLGVKGPTWYNSDRTNVSSGTSNDCFNCPGAQWTGTNTTNTTYTHPLNALAGQSNVIFRLVFHSDQSVTELGVTVDDFLINGVLSSETFTSNKVKVYPNPSRGSFNFNSNGEQPKEVTVYDLTGKIIYTSENIVVENEIFTVDLSDAAQGVYFVDVKLTGGNIVKRIVKE